MSQLNIDTLSNTALTKSVQTSDLVDGHCTAWVIFNGINLTIIDSFNISSVTRNSAGDYTVTFATPMMNANYGGLATVNNDTPWLSAICKRNVKTVSACDIQTLHTSGIGTWQDSTNVTLAIFGGK